MEPAMALEGAEWGAVAGVFVIILAMMLYNQTVAKRNATTAGAGPADSGKVSTGADASTYLSRFVVHEGDVVGEVVAKDGDQLVLKHLGHFRTVPEAGVKIINGEVHVLGEMDWNSAEHRGQDWLERNRKGRDDEVTSQLTASSDVRRPAFESFQSRKREASGVSEEE
jgi:hypothetical protein